MAKDRLAPCEFYQSRGTCSKGVTDGADMRGKCRTCNKYRPRKGFKPVDKKREAFRKEAKCLKGLEY